MFSQKTLDFLFENRLRDDKGWFTEHKSTYNEHVLLPLKELATALTPAVSAIDDRIVTTPGVGKTISRIYRDTRFSRDKTIFRDEMWLSFKREKGYPEFFFALWPGGLSLGCGYYCAPAETMETMRELILQRDPVFMRACADHEAQQTFAMECERHKRTKYPYQPQHIRSWLDRKTICFTAESADVSQLFSDALPQTVGKQFEKLTSIYRFFLHVEERKWKRPCGG